MIVGFVQLRQSGDQLFQSRDLSATSLKSRYGCMLAPRSKLYDAEVGKDVGEECDLELHKETQSCKEGTI